MLNLTSVGAEWVCKAVCDTVFKDVEVAKRKGRQDSRQWAIANALRYAKDYPEAVSRVRASGYKFTDVSDDDLLAALTGAVETLPETLPIPTTKPESEIPPETKEWSDDDDDDEGEVEDEDSEDEDDEE